MTSEDLPIVTLAEKIIAILNQGSYTFTYKYATLHAIIDLVVESPDPLQEPVVLYMPRLAERVIELYLPQTLPFSGLPVPGTLGQGTKSIVLRLEQFRREFAVRGHATAATMRRQYGDAFTRLCQDVEWTFARYPVLLLQKIGKDTTPFLYEAQWGSGITRKQVRDGTYDNRIILKPGVGPALLRLAGLLRPIIQSQWTRMIANFNLIPEARLEQFLFGVERSSLQKVAEPLRQLQDDRCFYCQDRFAQAEKLRPEVDHFVPWARYRDDSLGNLVAAHNRCNNRKRDHFAATGHLELWRTRLEAQDLSEVARQLSWDFDPARSESIARALYIALPEQTPLWTEGDDFVPLLRQHLPPGWIDSHAPRSGPRL